MPPPSGGLPLGFASLLEPPEPPPCATRPLGFASLLELPVPPPSRGTCPADERRSTPGEAGRWSRACRSASWRAWRGRAVPERRGRPLLLPTGAWRRSDAEYAGSPVWSAQLWWPLASATGWPPGG